MNRKGISPLIAAVLLIAFTMAVASLFAQWAPSLIQSAQGDTKNTTEEVQRCSSVVVNLRDSSNATHATIEQIGGDSSVGNMSVQWYYTNRTPSQAYAEITTTRGVKQINGGNTDSNADLDEIVVNPIGCEGAAEATYSP